MVVFIVVSYLLGASGVVGTPMMSYFSRVREYKADCFAAGGGWPLDDALSRLLQGVSESSVVYEAFYLDHPQLSKRLTHIGECAGK
jgi:Zn-dependent protease with chaperone function